MYKVGWELFPDTAKLSVELNIDKDPWQNIPEGYKIFFSQHDNKKQYLQQQFIGHHKKKKTFL